MVWARPQNSGSSSEENDVSSDDTSLPEGADLDSWLSASNWTLPQLAEGETLPPPTANQTEVDAKCWWWWAYPSYYYPNYYYYFG